MSEPSPPIAVRLARPDEYDAVGALTAEVYGDEGFAHGDYLPVLRDAARRAAVADVLVAVDAGGQLLGTLTYAPGGTPFADLARPGEAEFRMLAVRPAARGQGVATRLVTAAIARARAQGHRRLAISTQPAMTAAHRLYERLGFTRTPERDWSPEPGVNLRTYTLELAPPGGERRRGPKVQTFGPHLQTRAHGRSLFEAEQEAATRAAARSGSHPRSDEGAGHFPPLLIQIGTGPFCVSVSSMI